MCHLQRILIVSLFICLTLPARSQWLDFTDISSTNLTLSSVAFSDDEEKDMEPADLNNDGLTDLIVVRKEPFSAETEPPKSDLLLMNVGGALVDQTALYAPGFISNPSFARDVYIGDFDDDGWQDVVIANTFEQAPIYYRNRGNDGEGNWLGLVDESATRFPASLDDEILMCAVKGGDLDGDGDLDLYFVNYRGFSGEGTAKDFLFINDGNGNFTAEAEIRLGVLRNSAFGTEVEIKDMDNDGDNDIIKVSTLFPVSPWNANGVFVLFNEGDGFFSNWQNVSAPVSTEVYMIEIEDFNQDGQLDIFVVDDQEDFVLTANVINPDVSISYTSQVIPDLIPGISNFGGNIHAGDFDLDGDLDIAVADVDVDIPPCNSSRRFELARNDDGVFSYPYANETPAWATNVYDFAVMDVNNDGLLDLVTGNCSGYRIFQSDNCELAPITADYDNDGIADACDACPTNPDPDCIPDPTFPTVSLAHSVPRQWNELLLASIRRDLARPTVHARNLFHVSAAMWDVWAAFKEEGCSYLFGQTVDGFGCDAPAFAADDLSDEAIETAISYAAYRLLSHRFSASVNGMILQNAYDHHMNELGHDISFTSTDYSTGSPAALGNFIAECYINLGLQDRSNEQNGYGNLAYEPINDPLVVDNPGNPNITDLNRWQPLTLDLFIDQSGNVIPGATPGFLSPEWGSVTPFALDDSVAVTFQREGDDYKVYHNPGSPPLIQADGSGQSDAYQWGFATVAVWSSHLDPSDGVMLDISPAGIGNVTDFPTAIADYPNFYDQINGGTSASGYITNPVTGQPYAPNLVPRGDYARVIAEFWADGPDSETPPGHWFTILNEYVSDHPDFEKRIGGQGEEVGDVEWYVKSYFMLGGAMHDAAVTSWGIKGWYDYLRPVSAIRAMADRGQSTDTDLPSYDPQGIPLIDGYIELVDLGDPLAGVGNVNLGKIKLKAWLGHDVINNVDTDEAGVDWILAENWVPYQRPSFVTPNFAGYVSGHSTFSRTAATVLTSLTGTPYFPGGMGSFLAEQDEFLVFENGPSVDVELQWATYQDAANESALSRIWGGIHPPADDIPGRIMGTQIGMDAFQKAMSYFADEDGNGYPDLCQSCEAGVACDDEDPSTFDDVLDEACNCVGTPCPEAGTACDDGDATTFDDMEDGMCNCVGTPCPEAGTACDDSDATTFNDMEDGMCNCVGTPCPEAGTACDDGNATTFGDMEDGMCNCVGTPCPEAGTACDDSDATTFNDMEDGMCNCVGTPCPEVGTACDDGDATTFDDMEDGMCNCVGTPCPEAGTACDDGDATTFNDVEDGMCNCIGTPCPEAGTACDDGDATTFDDMEDGMCNCLGIPCPEAGTSCDDGDATTFDDMEDGMCNCIGTPCPEAGTSCDDGDATTFDDIEDGMCNCLGTPCPEAGTACDDGDATTFNDMEDGMCNCIGTPCPEAGTACDDGDATTFDDMEDGMCNCVGTPCPEAGTACDDGDATTFNDVEDGMCNCLGTPCPEAGTSCDDGDATTFDDVEDGMCNCIGTPCPEAGTSCDDGDATTFDDMEDGMCNCIGTPCPEAGTACDDGDATTFDDVEDGLCNCFGTPCPEAGTSCDDGDATTFNDVEDGLCNCVGTPCPEAGTACDDGDATTFDDMEDGMCNCVGTPCPEAGTACDDGDATTFNDVEDGMCNCLGTPCPEAGTACDDGDATTFDDVEDGMCNCIGTPCPEAGTACDDGDATTFDDVEDGMCNCIGTPCPEAGTSCDDGDPATINDVEDGMCNCSGVVSASSPTAAELLVRIAPNPATDELNVTISLPTAEVLRIATYDSNGKQMRSKQVEAQTATTIQLLTVDYPAGVYFLKVTTASGQVTKKFVVVH